MRNPAQNQTLPQSRNHSLQQQTGSPRTFQNVLPAASATSTSSMASSSTSNDLLQGEHLKEIIHSDVGVESLLSRLKQSIYSCKEVAQFIKKLAVLESEHAGQLKKTARTMQETFKRPEMTKGTIQHEIIEIVRANERLADAGNTFIDSMHRIHEEITEFVKNTDRLRKLEKESALRNEKNLIEAEQLADKAKARYDSAADDYERARSGDPSKKIALRQKSEEELQKKMTVAEMDYQQKVDAAVRMRRDLENRHRVDSVGKIKSLILESDNTLVLQITRFANLSEALQLNRGFVVAPLKPQNAPHAAKGLKEMADKIDPQLDLYNYILDIPKVKKYLNRPPMKFVKHAAGGAGSGMGGSVGGSVGTRATPSNISAPTSGSRNFSSNSTAHSTAPSSVPAPSRIVSSGTAKSGPVLASRSDGGGGATGAVVGAGAGAAAGFGAAAASSSGSAGAPPSGPSGAPSGPSALGSGGSSIPTGPSAATSAPAPAPEAPAYDPNIHGLATYGTPIEKLLLYEDSTVPRVVYQCVQAIDNFGLEVEDIYKTSGNAAQVTEIKRLFDVDAASVDLLRPSKSLNDIHSVASALKLYFKELPDPLLTKEHNKELINAVSIPDETRRRDTIHTIINLLPDANYTTLRYLVFHLFRVQELQGINKMSIEDLGLVWGPVLLSNDYSNTGEVPAQATVVSIILHNAYAIFDAE